jgi:hypothetical protein
MPTPARLVPLLDQFDVGCTRLEQRLAGPFFDSGNGSELPGADRLEELTATAAARKGPALLESSARPPIPSALALLLREYREARRTRRAR